jgi:hypothetical protein
VSVSASQTEIAVDRDGRLAAKPYGSGVSALAGHIGQTGPQLDVVELQADHLAAAGSRVVHEQEQRGVPAIVEAAPLGGVEQLPELVDGDDGHGRLRDTRRLHPLHWRAVDLVFLEGLAPELLERAELDRESRRLDLVTATGEVALDMLAADGAGRGGHYRGAQVTDQGVERDNGKKMPSIAGDEWRRGPRETVVSRIESMTLVVIDIDEATIYALRDGSGDGGLSAWRWNRRER